MKPYAIWAPRYRHNCAGIRVLYRLNDLLILKGMESYIGIPVKENGTVEVYSYGTHHKLPKDGEFIAIYPEIVNGEPYGAKKVVRYILSNRSPVRKADLAIYFDPSITENNSDPLILTIPTIERDIFNDRGIGLRSRSARYVGKGAVNGNLLGDVEITGDWPSTRKELADLFQKIEVLYSYDSATALTLEATLCGCPVVMMYDGVLERKKTEKVSLGMAGICWSVDEIDKARESLPMVAENYDRVENGVSGQIDSFIELTQMM